MHPDRPTRQAIHERTRQSRLTTVQPTKVADLDSTWFDDVVEVTEDDGQRVELGVVYKLEHATMPFAVWNGERFVGPRERFRLRLLETCTRAEGGWIEEIGAVITGVPLVAELLVEQCAICQQDATTTCEKRGHEVIEEAVPNRDLLAMIDAATAPWLEAEAEARCAAEVEEILLRAFRWEAFEGYHYDPSTTERMALCRRLNQLPEEHPERTSIEAHFPNLVCKLQA